VEDLLAETLASLRRNGFGALYAADVGVAREAVLSLIPVGATVGVGDSVSVRQLGVLEELEAGGRLVVNPFGREVSLRSTAGEISETQRWHMHKQAVNCEYFITGANAVTRDGMLVSTDAGGNRVGGMIFGPQQVVIVVGKNKIVRDLEEAFHRIKNVIAPALCRIKGRKTPCAVEGRCTDCRSPERACHVTVVLERCPTYTPVTVVLVDADLGLGWDEDWPRERVEQIYAACSALTWLKRQPDGSDLSGKPA
jgi:hypothetical protein